MHLVFSAVPCGPLREYVRAFAQREIECAGPDIVQPVPAGLEQTLELDFCRSPIVEYTDGRIETAPRISIVGPHTYRRASIRLRGPIDSFGIFFQPLGLWELFRVPVGLLVNRAFAGEDVFGSEIERLWERMAGTRSFEERVCRAEEFLLERAGMVAARSAVMNSAASILEQRGAIRISEVALDAGSSLRHYERQFTTEIGIAPKLFARIARYQRALDAKITTPTRPWLNIAHEFGYYDQMHMIRDFESLGGDTPTRTLMQLGDMRPPALAAR